MKHFNIFILFLSSALWLGCTQTDLNEGGADSPDRFTFRLHGYASNTASAFDMAQVESIDGYSFKEGVLVGIYKGMPVDKDGHAVIKQSRDGERFYFLANAAGIVDEASMQNGALTESMLLAMVIKAESPLADGQTPFMTGMCDLTGNNKRMEVLLKRGIARIDLNIAEGTDIQIKNIRMESVRRDAFLFPQEPVASPADAQSGEIDLSYETAPGTGAHEGLLYLYEQAGEGIPVLLEGTVNGVEATMKTILPPVIKRNFIYRINVSSTHLSLTVTISEQPWEEGETTEIRPETTDKPLVDMERSELPEEVTVSASRDTVYVTYVPYSGANLLLALTTPSDMDLVTDPASGITIAHAQKSNPLLPGNRFLVNTPARVPSSRMECVHLQIHDRSLTHYYGDHIVLAYLPHRVNFEGEAHKYIRPENPYASRIDRYIDGIVGYMNLPSGATVSISEQPWLRIAEESPNSGRYVLTAGYKPNDPQADGRFQEAALTVSLEDGREEIYTVSRRNQGLPVVEINDEYWCMFNLRGNSKSFEDQIQINEVPEEDLYTYLKNCPDEEFVRLMGDGYVASYQTGLPFAYGPSGFNFDGYDRITDYKYAEPWKADWHCPDGYQVPTDKQYEPLLGKFFYYSFEEDQEAFGVPYFNSVSAWRYARRDIRHQGATLDNESFIHKITKNGFPTPLVLGGMGSQSSDGTYSSRITYQACVSDEGLSYRFDRDHRIDGSFIREPFSNDKVRVVRCIKKMDNVFIY